MTERKRSYMGYLNDPCSPMPKSTKHSRAKRTLERLGRILNSGSSASSGAPTDLSHSISSQNEEYDDDLDFKNDKYENLFNRFTSLVDENDVGECDNVELQFDMPDFDFDFEEEDEDDFLLLTEDATDHAGFLYEGADITLHELAVLLLTLKTAFNLSAIALSFVLQILRLVIPKNSATFKSLKELYAYFGTVNVQMRRHFYCGNCQYYVGVKKPSPDQECELCKKKKFQHFVDIRLENELQKIIQNNWKYLNHRFERTAGPMNRNISDVYDGTLYRKNFDAGFLNEVNNVSLLGNTDGVAIFKSSAFSVWPIYMVVNELPPSIRFRRENRILCGLWFGREKPNFPTFFKPFTELLWELYTDGFTITDENGTEKRCRALLLQMTCDSPAKCLFQDFTQFNGYYGCPYCLNPGVYNKIGHCQTYPYNIESPSGCSELRTHMDTIEHAHITRKNLADGKKKYAEKGVKGMSWGFSLPNFDIINSMCLDYMHAVLLGVMKHLLNLWFTKDKMEMFSISKKIKTVQERLMQIKPPNNVTRTPRTLDDLKHWKASEYRSFLLFYGPVCLYEVLPQIYYDHFMLLSTSIWLLLQQEISQRDLDEATRHLRYFCYQMSALYARAVNIVQKLPEMVKSMDPDSAAARLQKKMTHDRYKAKLVTLVKDRIYVVGKSEEITSDKDLFQLIELAHPFCRSKPMKYKRALIHGQMIHSKSYQKVSQRNSFTVSFALANEKCYGAVQYFVDLNISVEDYVHEKASDYYAVVNKFRHRNLDLTNDETTGMNTKHLHILEKQREDLMLIPLSAVQEKVIFMDVNGLDFIVVGHFPNTIEKD
ncbi:hypothetical protein KUTeg_005735 [Tegillarca granosa]|uniref:Transposase domain-containing protein n=1 Tax=Tegillarca granosa TaxID=220873 RepID=A0ABQ9FHC2_TEGGR|nr:hypothetical protein KUTeg_005735 [Tegillarca granosa]